MKLTPRELALVKLVARWRIIILAVVDRVFGYRNEFYALCENNRILQLRSRALPGSVTYAELGRDGARLLDLPMDRATRPLSGDALDLSIAALWHGFMRSDGAGPALFRLHHRELAALFDDQSNAKPNTVFLLADRAPSIVYRAYLVRSDVATVTRHAEDQLDRALANTELRRWVHAGDFRMLAFADDEAKVERLRNAVQRRGRVLAAFFEIAFAPTARTLNHKFLKTLRKKK